MNLVNHYTSNTNNTKYIKMCEFNGTSKKLCKMDECKICFEKSFASYEKSKYWIVDKNNNILPRDVFKHRKQKFWFECHVCHHAIYMSLDDVSGGYWCGFCTNKKLCENQNCKICFEKSFASHKFSKCWSSNNSLTARQVFKNSNHKCFFNCDKCTHLFSTRVSHINRGNFCPYCCKPCQKLCDDDKCQLCFNNSFASYKYSNLLAKTNKLTARQIMKHTLKVYDFVCNKCNHIFQTKPHIITMNCGCPYCCVPSQKICDDIQCKICFNNSFASCDKSKFWSAKNKNILPRQVHKWSHYKYYFDCDKCNHTFLSPLNDVMSNVWCSYCSNHTLCDDQNCQICFEKSFASYPRSNNLVDKTIDARKIFKYTHKKYSFECDTCHNTFNCLIYSISIGSWCPFCKNKTEIVLHDWLITQFNNYTVTYQKTFTWCKNIETNYIRRFDFYIEELKLVIELDGEQHFSQTSNWKSPEKTQETDIYKMKCLQEHGISVIRLLQLDVFHNKTNWKNDLSQVIKKYDVPEIIYIENGTKYDVYKNQM